MQAPPLRLFPHSFAKVQNIFNATKKKVIFSENKFLAVYHSSQISNPKKCQPKTGKDINSVNPVNRSIGQSSMF